MRALQDHSRDSDLFDEFRASLDRPDILEHLRAGLIGEGVAVPGAKGSSPLIYADYVASGRALLQIETCILHHVLPYYANSHTEASYCGQMMTRLRHKARRIILELCGAGPDHQLIFTGSGATSGINRIVGLLDLRGRADEGGSKPLVLIGPYEHHSNILPWRECGAEVIEIGEAATGGPDMAQLRRCLMTAHGEGRFIVGSFSAASNVTGIVTDVRAVTTLLKSYGAVSIWDYAGAGPYLPIALNEKGAEIDAVVVSTHKFIGGPAASGVTIIKRDIVSRETPTLPGGGTVHFVSPWAHDYSQEVSTREEAGTPNVVGDLRAALAFLVKDAIGQDYMTQRLEEMRRRAVARWSQVPQIEVLGAQDTRHALPIFSFRVADGHGGYVHQQLVTRILSDHFGIQARGGCACAGPYAHRLLDIDRSQSDRLRGAILSGKEILKPGWTRLGFSALMTDDKVDVIIEAVAEIASNPSAFSAGYTVDERTARFSLSAV